METSFFSTSASEGVTESTGETSRASLVLAKDSVISRISPGDMGVSMAERVVTTTGWGTLSRARAGMEILSLAAAWTMEMLLW